MTEPAPSPVRPTGRSDWIEWARVLSCAGIVWFHAAAPYENIALGGLIAFTVLGGAFIRPVNDAQGLRSSAGSRAMRLLMPWFIWSLIYGALRVVEALRQGEPAFAWLEPQMTLYGTWAHLWFLPFLFVATLVMQSVDLIRPGGVSVTRLLGWALVVATPAFVWLEHNGPGKPMEQWFSVLPALGLGVLLRGVRPGEPAARRLVFLMLVVDAAAIAAAALLMPEHRYSLPKHIVGGLVIVSWLAFRPASTLALRLGAITLVVYLAHPLVLVISERILHLDIHSAIVAAPIVVISFALGWAIDSATRFGAGVWPRLTARPTVGSSA